MTAPVGCISTSTPPMSMPRSPASSSSAPRGSTRCMTGGSCTTRGSALVRDPRPRRAAHRRQRVALGVGDEFQGVPTNCERSGQISVPSAHSSRRRVTLALKCEHKQREPAACAHRSRSSPGDDDVGRGCPSRPPRGWIPTKTLGAARQRDAVEVVEGLDAVAVGSEEVGMDVEGGRVAGVEADGVDADADGVALLAAASRSPRC